MSRPLPIPLRSQSVKANAKTLGKQLKEERPGSETAAEVARQRMLALVAAEASAPRTCAPRRPWRSSAATRSAGAPRSVRMRAE